MVAKKVRGGLGKGLAALLGDKSEIAELTRDAKPGEQVIDLDIEKIQAGQYQPRSKMDDAALQELAQSIREQGIISPIIVRAISDGRFEIIAGERRFRASQKIGLKTVPAIVRNISNEKALAWALIENIQRENLNPMEEAKGIFRLVHEFNMTHELASQAIGRSRTATTNLLRLLNLEPEVQQLVLQNQLSMGHARSLLSLKREMQIAIAQEVIDKSMSVRQTERLVSQLGEKKKSSGSVNQKSQDTLRLETGLSDRFGTTVKVNSTANGRGKIVIEFKNLDQLDGILEKLGEFA